VGADFRVDPEICTRCGACADACPTGAKELCGVAWDSDALVEKVLEDRDFFISSGGGVTLSGGECMHQIDFAEALAKRLFEQGISVDIDTCGYVRFESFQRIIPYADVFLYDLKAIDPQVHKRCTGRDNELILENLKRLDELGCRVEIRYPYVPGWNDGECEKIGAFLAELKHVRRIKVLGYHGFAAAKYDALSKENTLPAVTVTREDVQKAVDILTAYGLEAINGMDGD
jgi:pyruvate formate lyase activating enzyme